MVVEMQSFLETDVAKFWKLTKSAAEKKTLNTQKNNLIEKGVCNLLNRPTTRVDEGRTRANLHQVNLTYAPSARPRLHARNARSLHARAFACAIVGLV